MGNKKFEIRIAGKGGQGILTAGYILGKAIALYEDKNVAQTQSYGPEARGGASRTDLIISDSQIFYTKVRKADYLVVLSQEAYDKYISSFPEATGTLIADSYITLKNGQKGKILLGDFEKIARDDLKNPLAANLVMLGYLCAVSSLANSESVKKVISGHFKKKFEESNFKAFDMGFEAGKKNLKSQG